MAEPIDDRFIGRGTPVAALRRLIDDAMVGRGGVALVRGEAGIGKSRLVAHVVAGYPTDPGAAVLWGRGREGGAPPLWPWRQMLRSARRAGLDIDWAPAADRAGDAWRSGQDRFALFDSASEALIDAAELRPMVVILDDLQWADDDSQALFEFLAATVTHARIALIGTVRTDEREAEPVARRLLASAHRPAVSIDLEGLGRSELVELLVDILGATPDDELVDAVRRHTAGNPLFVRQVARLVESSGRAVDPAAWRGVLPEGVRAVLGRRLARLPQPSHVLLATAALLGVEFDLVVLAAVSDLEVGDTAEGLDAAVAAGLINDLGQGRFGFGHALIADVAAAEMGTAARQAAHRRAAAVLEALTGDRAAAEIAHHVLAAGDRASSVTWCRRAAHQAAASAMHADAAAWFARALELADDADRVELLVDFGAAASRVGRVAEAEAALAEAARRARQAGDTVGLARAALGVGALGGGFEVRLLDDAQIGLLEESLTALGADDTTWRSWLLARLSVALTMRSDQERRHALADEAVAVARRAGDAGALAYALSAWCDSRAGPSGLSLRLAASEEMLAAASQSGDPELELLARRFRITALLEHGDIANATRHIDAFVRLADRLRQPQFAWFARLMEGMLAHLHGDLDTAESLAALALAEGRRAGSANAHMLAEGALGAVIDRDRGDAEGFLRRFRAATNPHPEAARGLDVGPLFVIDIALDLDHVRRFIREVPPDALPIDEHDGLFLQAVTLYAYAAASVGERDHARRATASIEPYVDHLVLDGTGAVVYGPVSLWLGKIAAALGDEEVARRHLDKAADYLRAIDAPLLLADATHTLVRIGVGDTRHEQADAPPDRFCRDGEVWNVSYAGRGARFADTKGLHDLAMLLSRPRQHLHVLDLVGSTATAGGALGPVLDSTARRSYEARIRELTDDIEEAEANHDLGRVERLEDEREQLLRHLADALGLSGRARRAGPDPTERARKAVGMRMRSAIDRIDRELPDLGRHLRASVRTGIYCAYEPEHDRAWIC